MQQLFAILGCNRETVRNYLLSLCYKMRVETKIIKTLFMTQLTNKIMSFRTLDKKRGRIRQKQCPQLIKVV